MAKFKLEGMDEYLTALGRLGGKQAEKVIKYAVYPGAAVVADALRAEIETKHSDTGDLARSLTLATMRNDNGFVNTKVMFTGYDQKGVPNAIKAAVLESGNSKGRKATHFISKTVRSVEAKASAAMSSALDEKIAEIMEG